MYIYTHTIQIQYVIINTQTYIHIPSISSPPTTWRPRHLKAWALAWRLSMQPPDNIFLGWFPSIFGELFMRLVGNIPDDLEYRTLTIAKIIWWNCCCLVGALAISSWGKNYQPLVAPPFEMDHQIITTIGIIVILILIIAILTIMVTTIHTT